MNQDSWRQFLTNRGAHWDGRGVSHFAKQMIPHLDNTQIVLTDLSIYSAIVVTGKGARQFLQGQVTCDMALVSSQQWQRGACCNIKGRALFSFHCVEWTATSTESFLLILPTSTVEIALSHLKKYGVFARLQIERDNTIQLLGLIAEPALLSSQAGVDLNDNLINVVQTNCKLLSLAGSRHVCIVALTGVEACWTQLTAIAQPQGYSAWQLASIRAGVAEVEAETSGEFIPQLLNFHLTAGISFTKGCYLGQEVVARMAYKGTLKRHLRHAIVTTERQPSLNDPLFGDGNEQSIGNIVTAVKTDTDSFELLVVVTDADFDKDRVFLDRQKSRKLRFLSLPYAITK